MKALTSTHVSNFDDAVPIGNCNGINSSTYMGAAKLQNSHVQCSCLFH